jgi:two-component system sensor histidine kinase YesM
MVTRQLRRSVAVQIDQTISQVETSLSVYLQTMEHLLDFVAELALEGDSDLPSLFSKLRFANPEVAGILLARVDDTFVSDGLARVSRDPFSSEGWYRQASEAHGDLVVLRSNAGRNVTTEDVFSSDDVFSLAKALYDPVTGSFLGVVLIDVNHDVIRNSSKNASIGKQGFVFILDAQDEVVYAPVNPVVYRVNPLWLTKGDSSITVEIAGQRYYLQGKENSLSGWQVVGVFPASEVLHDMTTTVYVMIISLFGSLFSIAILSYLLSSTIQNRSPSCNGSWNRLRLKSLGPIQQPLHR